MQHIVAYEIVKNMFTDDPVYTGNWNDSMWFILYKHCC